MSDGSSPPALWRGPCVQVPEAVMVWARAVPPLARQDFGSVRAAVPSLRVADAILDALLPVFPWSAAMCHVDAAVLHGIAPHWDARDLGWPGVPGLILGWVLRSGGLALSVEAEDGRPEADAVGDTYVLRQWHRHAVLPPGEAWGEEAPAQWPEEPRVALGVHVPLEAVVWTGAEYAASGLDVRAWRWR